MVGKPRGTKRVDMVPGLKEKRAEAIHERGRSDFYKKNLSGGWDEG